MTDPAEVLHDNADTYEQKNEDYGDSWRLVGELLWKMAGEEPITLESKEDCISFGLFTRRMDKLSRAINGEFAQNEMNYEDIVDSHEDESTYAAMHATLLHNSDDDEDTVMEDEGLQLEHITATVENE